MNARIFWVVCSLITTAAFAADLPPVPTQSLAKKKELLFSDNMESNPPAKPWHRVVDTFKFENGVLKGTQTRVTTIPAANGKPAITAHAAVYGLEIPTKDSVVEVRINLAGATSMDVEFDDRKYTEAHYGHLCRAIVRTNGVTIMDEREGSQNLIIKKLKEDPTKKEEVAKLMKGKQVTYPAKIEQNKWYTMTVETVGDEMRVLLDGKPMAYLKSPGIGHVTKSKIELGVGGKDGLFDDIKVWNAEPLK